MAWQVGLLIALMGQAPEAGPAVTVRLDRPDEQVRRIIALFDGTTAPHPAAALAQWKRATGGMGTLGKSYEALIAAFNPGMAEELRSFDGAELQMTFPPDAVRPRWNATLPVDTSHVFAAFATAMALTDGGPEPPLGVFQVDRLGPQPGGVLMAHDGSRVILAPDRDDLLRGRERLAEPATIGEISRFRMSGFPDRLHGQSLNVQRALEAARGLAIHQIDVNAGFEGDTFTVEAIGQMSRPQAVNSGIEPSWLDLPSSDRAIAVAAMTFDRSPEGLDRMFAAVDRMEKADPARAKVAAARTRLNLLALGAGIRPEVDLWPKLAGISANVIAGENGRIGAAVAALHAVDEPSAERLARDVLPKLARAAGLKGNGNGDGVLGTVGGRDLAIRRKGASVLLIWGSVVESPNQAVSWKPIDGEPLPCRFVRIHPGRIPSVTGTPLGEALATLPPIIWQGDERDGRTVDRLRVTGLNGAVRAFLKRLPHTPAPAETRAVDPPTPVK